MMPEDLPLTFTESLQRVPPIPLCPPVVYAASLLSLNHLFSLHLFPCLSVSFPLFFCHLKHWFWKYGLILCFIIFPSMKRTFRKWQVDHSRPMEIKDLLNQRLSRKIIIKVSIFFTMISYRLATCDIYL